MGIELIIALVMALLSYFASKKAGANDATAAMVAAGAGLGSYYVATETDWGKGVVADIDSAWTALTDDDGDPVLDAEGNPVYAPPGSTATKDGSGGWTYKLLDTTGEVLTSWGAAGTAGVIATTAAVSGDTNKWLLMGGAALLLIMAMR